MKTTLLQVGKTTDKHIAALTADYISRLGHYMPFAVVTIPDVKSTASLTPERLRQAEGEAILRQVQPSDCLVLFDEHGAELRSTELASWLQKKQTAGRPLVMVIGGAFGFSPEVYARADERLSLSKLTFSHQMVRLVATEQIYRAATILKGEHYHHE